MRSILQSNHNSNSSSNGNLLFHSKSIVQPETNLNPSITSMLLLPTGILVGIVVGRNWKKRRLSWTLCFHLQWCSTYIQTMMWSFCLDINNIEMVIALKGDWMSSPKHYTSDPFFFNKQDRNPCPSYKIQMHKIHMKMDAVWSIALAANSREAKALQSHLIRYVDIIFNEQNWSCFV